MGLQLWRVEVVNLVAVMKLRASAYFSSWIFGDGNTFSKGKKSSESEKPQKVLDIQLLVQIQDSSIGPGKRIFTIPPLTDVSTPA